MDIIKSLLSKIIECSTILSMISNSKIIVYAFVSYILKKDFISSNKLTSNDIIAILSFVNANINPFSYIFNLQFLKNFSC